MTILFSDNGTLTPPIAEHSIDGRYAPITKGQPLLIEFLHLAFGVQYDGYF